MSHGYEQTYDAYVKYSALLNSICLNSHFEILFSFDIGIVLISFNIYSFTVYSKPCAAIYSDEEFQWKKSEDFYSYRLRTMSLTWKKEKKNKFG